MSSLSIIAYIRVSTQKQGQSGLGLDAQLTAIKQYTHEQRGEIVQMYREIESGRRDDRPELAKAIKHAKRIKAKLVIAKLDRLARDVHFVSGLTKSGVDFIACDNPVANKLTIHILAAVAQYEAEQISARTKAALAEAKKRGIKLGSARPGHWRGKEHLRRAAALRGSMTSKARRDEAAREAYGAAMKVAQPLRHAGSSLNHVARVLNAQNLRTIHDCSWTSLQVGRMFKLHAAASA